MKLSLKTALACSLALASMAARADDTAFTAKLEMADGKLSPARIEVPAGKRIRIEVSNTGKGAAEFESVELRKEKVLAPGASSVVVIAPQQPGEYKFFDDFHQSARGVLVVK